MRRNMRKLVAVVALGVVVGAVLASMALAGTTSKLPAAQSATPIASSGAVVQPQFIGAVVNAVAAVFTVRAVDYALANRVALAAALEASTYTTIALATPAGGASSADTQFDNSSG